MNIGSIGSSFSYGVNRTERPQGPPPSPEDFASNLIKDLDSDADGALSVAEISASEHPGLSKMLEEADGDGDGLVSKSELVSHAEERAKAFADRSQLPPPSLSSTSEIDFSSLLKSLSEAATAYRNNALNRSSAAEETGLSLAV